MLSLYIWSERKLKAMKGVISKIRGENKNDQMKRM